MDIRVRHNRGKKRATLVTVRDGAWVCFGIARCHSSKDTYDRATGRFIAEGRAVKELENLREHNGQFPPLPGLTVHTSGLRGRCLEDNVHELLDYFRGIHKNQFVVGQFDTNRLTELAGLDGEYLEGCSGDDDPCDTCPGCNSCSPSMRGRL
jgi:hypothetical protein